MDEFSTVMPETTINPSAQDELEAVEPAPILIEVTSRQFSGGYIDSISCESPNDSGIVPKATATVVGNRNPNLRTRRNIFISLSPKPNCLEIKAFAERIPTAMAGRSTSAVSFLLNFLIHNRLASTAESQFLTALYTAMETTDASNFIEESIGDAWVRDVSIVGSGERIRAQLLVFAPELSAEQIAGRLRQKMDDCGATVEVAGDNNEEIPEADEVSSNLANAESSIG